MYTLSESYTLASKVRTKLTREAANPKASLRSLVVQANMLDNLMDHIDSETQKRSIAARQKKVMPTVTFDVSHKTSVTEYEVDSDSDSDSDDEESGFELEYESDSEDEDEDEDDDYYYSDEESEEESVGIVTVPSFKQLPAMNLSAILEESEEEEEHDLGDRDSMPELCRTPSLTDDEEDMILDTYTTAPLRHRKNEKEMEPRIASLFHASGVHEVHHEELTHGRHNAIYSMEHIF